MLMKVKRIGLRMRIVLVSVTLVAFLAGNSVYNVSKILQLRNAYQFLLESVMAKKNYLLELYSHLNRMMFLESEFELTLNNGYHDRAMDYLERSRQILARLDELEQNSFDSLDSRGIQELLMDFNRLRDLVSASRDKTVRKGLTRDSGLQGSLDDNARVLEEALGQYGTPEMMGDYQALRRYEKNLMIMVTEEDGEQASQVVNHLRGLIGSRFGEGGRAASLLTMVDNYMGDFDKLVTIQNELEELHSQRASLLAALETGLESRQQDVESVLEGSLNKLQQEMARNRRMAMFISGLAFLAAVAMTVLLMIRIREPMRLALESVDHLSRGDLSHKVSYGHNDEMGDIIGGINSASESLASLMKEVMIFAERGRDSSVVLAGESEDMQSAIAEIQANLLSIKQRGGELSAISGKTLSGAETINNNVYRLDTMIESLSGGIRETTAAIEQMTANIQNVSDISRKKGDTINKLLLQARENGKEIHNTSLLTGEIAGLAQGIGEIIGVINGIASRTNLLAMNAAIEAAHAGDTGRGFAVVADEIRKLAESSAENASRIGQMLGNVSQKIEQVARSSQSSTGSFEQIEDGIGSFTQSFTEITNAMEEMASGSTHVLDASQSMKGELAEVAEMAGSISEETGGIREGAESMDGQIVSLARGIDEMLTALTEISRSSRKVAESARTSLEKMEGLNGEISRFKTEEPVEELVLV